ncbi:hypothetical protein CC85DRAFT_286468 [Cutaneotrichosporon oleaginosum]|uniref:RING-type E3 ubiquitin transferase n=1 Tax=Cutaneotrichosporon oleaginosum TaxID=879819 RepID=A0A0J0XK33_9TREE|nr:uncharacterized protein CC85DRAFT_286468 [Cutaneotrichosporon oleaginosum]KLT41435.1 hypothetical protein CC85DRAFT_286468 [Cutaneotrichosporon oleaginosum]TXT12197.1 hypothetical protein COLE_02607 [Cutaneotrichosporon oleaginosum]
MADDAARDAMWGSFDEEGDLCRVCRTEAEDSKPLIYPCKCSGSVRYVHSDCLQEWLSRSKKRYCEICGHPYTFTKVYPSSLPSVIPTMVYIRQSLFVAGRLAWRVMRICIAIVSWLVILPVITMASLRIILAVVDHIAHASLSYGLKSAITDSYHDLNGTFVLSNDTDGRPRGRDLVLNAVATNGTLDFLPTFFDRISADGRNPIAFVFRGQIVAISVATGLIGLILLREWIAQQEWHARPPVEEEGEFDTSLWTFRNGQAIRLTDIEHSSNAESNRAAAGTDVGDTGDTETIIADGDLDSQGPVAPHETEEGDMEHDTEESPALPAEVIDTAREQAQERKPRPALTHASFDALTRVGEATARIPLWENNAEAGPSRGVADVPEDVVADTPPLLTSQQLDTPRASGQESPHGTRHEDDFFETLETVPGGAGSQSTLEFSPTFRRASDPGPDGNLESPRAERQFGSQGLMEPALPIIAESPPDTPPLDVQQALDTRMGALLGVPDGPSSPESVGTPETGEFEHDDQVLRGETSPGDLVRTETEDNETDVDVDQETDANADVELEHIEERVEVDDPQWRHFEAALGDDDRFVVNVEFVQQVMARNELDGVGMEIPPEDEDDRPLDAEDWDGIFEVVGFIGPLTGLLHNHIFVSFAMAFTLTVMVGLPTFVGKVVLATDFIRASGDGFITTIRSISFVSDCLLRGVAMILKELLAFPRLVAKPATDYIMDSLNVTSIAQAFDHTASLFSHPIVAPEAIASINYTSDVPVVGVLIDQAISGLEVVGETAHTFYKTLRLGSISIAASPDSGDHFVSLMVGYMTLSLAVICIAIIDAANLIQLSHSFMERARTVQTFLKVVFFMTLEIVCFPIFVGIVIDLCTLPLFGTTMSQRLVRIAGISFGKIFVTWACGTVFMISFAAFLTHMRTISRAGALYFIRDPSDPTHSPVKEIMDRPALAQFPRLAVSATMYTVVVFAVCGAVPWLLHAFSALGFFSDFLPLRLDQRPLSSVPFDILFLHLIIPPSWEMLYLPHRMRKLFVVWWGYAVKKLRLVSLIFGMEVRPKPSSYGSHIAWLLADAACQFIFGRYDNRATRARVPASDRVELATLAERRREGVFIPVDQRGAPRTEADRIRLLKQDFAARKAGRNPKADYTIVSLPDFWRTRVYALLAFMLFSASCVTAGLIFVPLALGRQATALWFGAPVYDGYSWVVGIYLCLISYNMGQSAKKHIIDSSRAERLRRSQKSTRVKRWLLGVTRAVYAVFMLYLVLPLIVGINFELFISLPVRYGFSNDIAPVLHVWDAWATGTSMISLYVGGVGLAADEALPRVPPTFRDAFKRPLRMKFGYITKLTVPLAGYLIIPIILPWFIFVALRSSLQMIGVPLPQVDNGWAFRMMYPVSTTVLLVSMSWRMIAAVLARVRQWMIDAEYVVEERVENYEPGAEAEVEGEVRWPPIAAENEGIPDVLEAEEGWVVLEE